MRMLVKNENTNRIAFCAACILHITGGAMIVASIVYVNIDQVKDNYLAETTAATAATAVIAAVVMTLMVNYCPRSVILYIQCVFTKNSASIGGVLRAFDTTEVAIYNSTLSRNSGSDVLRSSSYLEISDTWIMDSVGSAITMELISESAITISKLYIVLSTIQNSTATSSAGGAINTSGKTLMEQVIQAVHSTLSLPSLQHNYLATAL
jgi:hypothetical protein